MKPLTISHHINVIRICQVTEFCIEVLGRGSTHVISQCIEKNIKKLQLNEHGIPQKSIYTE